MKGYSDMRKIIVLVGNIASGKTTFTNERDTKVLSRDALRCRFNAGKYVFDREKEPMIQDLLEAQLENAMLLDETVVIDATHMTKKSRAWILRIGEKYDAIVIAVVFKDRGLNTSVDDRMKCNHGDTPREVWEQVFIKFWTSYERPTEDEGFFLVMDQ